MSIIWEKSYPWLGGLIAFWLWGKINVGLPADDDATLLSSAISFGAIIAGFLATSQSILMALSIQTMKNLRSSGYINDLASYLTQAILLAFLFAVISLCGFFRNDPPFGQIWFSSGIMMILSFFRVTRITMAILRKG
ncbi:MAG: hypothetical protein OEV91_01380 [Desulfobulbaceae bacterium]|nr:hypothetical protein [Desulfobulbaceae bacterium]